MWYNKIMDTLIHADIFFFITTIAVIVISIILGVVLYYLVKILKNVRDITESVKEETNLIRKDIQDARENIKVEGFKLKHLISFFSSFLKDKKGRKTK
jgi:5-bromo-4-chloroindolyl phosphate hydrolysis protein